MFAINLPSMINRILLIFLLFFCKTLLLGQTIAERIMPPEGYVRTEVAANSFASYLRRLPLQPEGSKVLLYNGETKRNQLPAYAVVDLDIGKRDLQQCADAVIRLRAEYLYGQKQYAAIHFNFTNGFNAEYTKWAKGNHPKAKIIPIKHSVPIWIWYFPMQEQPPYRKNWLRSITKR